VILSTEGFDGFVASAASSIATGWSDPIAGRDLHPLEFNDFHGAPEIQKWFGHWSYDRGVRSGA
jgi:hypothetical protein